MYNIYYAVPPETKFNIDVFLETPPEEKDYKIFYDKLRELDTNNDLRMPNHLYLHTFKIFINDKDDNDDTLMFYSQVYKIELRLILIS